MISALEGITDVSAIKKSLAAHTSGADYQRAVKEHSQIQERELAQQQELAQQFTIRNEQWWDKKITELNLKAGSSKTGEEHKMYRRLLNYLGLVGYMQTNHALNSGDLTNAAIYLQIFKKADPKNPDVGYLWAIYYMKKGEQQQAISSLNEAAANGYSELTSLISDPVFSSLQNNEAYKKVVKIVRANAGLK